VADFRSSLPFREVNLIAHNDTDVYFSFVDLNLPLPRGRYPFPTGTSFRLRTDDDDIEIVKEGTFDNEDRWVWFEFLAADTSMVVRDSKIYYEVDCFIPKGPQAVQTGNAGGQKQYSLQLNFSSKMSDNPNLTSRHTVLRGYLLISSHRNLNEGS
jgi:hypothetical protein